MPAQSLSDLVESITVDSYGTYEQLTAFLTVFDEAVLLPCAAMILDVEVEIRGFDLMGNERGGLVARGRRPGGSRGVVALADVRFESGTVAAWLHAGYRKWLGLKSFPARRAAGWAWPDE